MSKKFYKDPKKNYDPSAGIPFIEEVSEMPENISLNALKEVVQKIGFFMIKYLYGSRAKLGLLGQHIQIYTLRCPPHAYESVNHLISFKPSPDVLGLFLS